MAFRRPAGRGSRKQFKRRSGKTDRLNVTSPRRGGIRL